MKLSGDVQKQILLTLDCMLVLVSNQVDGWLMPRAELIQALAQAKSELSKLKAMLEES